MTQACGSCGWPALGVEVQLHDAKDGVGELLIRGPNVVGALLASDQPACDAEGWFHTGDLAARAGADGSYSVAGHAKDLIISGGENIHPAEIEGRCWPNIPPWPSARRSASPMGSGARKWWRWRWCGGQGLSFQNRNFKRTLAGRLARFKLPHRWFFMDSLPKTALGKIQRGALAQLAKDV